MDTVLQLSLFAKAHNYPVQVIGIPKTIDNDLPYTDHCPGYGSVIKYNATTVMEIAIDVRGMATDGGSCCIIEVMGRDAGWIAAGTVLAKRSSSDAPHIILVPEVAFHEETFLSRVKQIVSEQRYCIVVVGEGLKNQAGEEISADKNRRDAFGHPLLSGVADHLAEVVHGKLNLKTRTVKLGYAQRAAAHCASAVDVAEAAACGEAAVRAAVEGKSGFMVKLVRTAKGCITDLHDLKDIANEVHSIPKEWINEEEFLPNEKFIEYARPLIEGEVKLPLEGGLPRFVTLEKNRVEKKLLPHG
jgi:6-phosphofructokinase 1